MSVRKTRSQQAVILAAIAGAMALAVAVPYGVKAQQPAAGAVTFSKGHRADSAAQLPELSPARWCRADVARHLRRGAAVRASH